MEESISIAIADDHPLVRNGIAGALCANNEFRLVAEAGNGQDLIAQIQALAAPPDVCLLDIHMPGMNGYDTLPALRQRYPSTRCLILTAFETQYSVVSMIKNGARGYLLKTCTPAVLISAVRAVHRQGYYYSDIASEEVFRIVKRIKAPNDLTEKEIRFLSLCCTDMTYEDIARQMYLSARTIADYQKRLADKLQIRNRTGLAIFAISSGLIPMKHLK